MSCDLVGPGQASETAPTAKEVCHTLLYQLYRLAAEDEGKIGLLEDCNKVFKNPKTIMRNNSHDVSIPEFSAAFCAIAEHLGIRITIALDEVNVLSLVDQQELATKLKAILKPVGVATPPIKIIAGCRSGYKFHNLVQSLQATQCVDLGHNNHEDILAKLSSQLKAIPGLSEAEQKEAVEAIMERAGPRFAYVDDIAIPFMREPFKRPLSKRLQQLPEGMNSIYNEALRTMAPNYVELLRTALTWTLFAPVPPYVEEIMDAYNGLYDASGPDAEAAAFTLESKPFSGPTELEIEQLRDACGPFLRLARGRAKDEHLVMLQDGPRIRDFCLHLPEAGDTSTHEVGQVCARCQGALSESKAFKMSPKGGHLEMAITCLRHLNSPTFQKHATADDDNPMWCEDKAPAESNVAGDFEHGAFVQDDINADQDRDTRSLAEEGAHADDNEFFSARYITSADELNMEINAAEGEYDSDDSMENDDLADFNLPALVEDDDSKKNLDVISSPRKRDRYELKYWTYHLRKAEELWTREERATSTKWDELIEELEKLVTIHSGAYFERWQDRLVYEDNGIFFSVPVGPLHLAAFFGLSSWAEHLLSQGAAVNQVSGPDNPHTPIMMAAYRANCRPMLNLLLESGADPNFSTYSGSAFNEWIFHDASVESIELMLKHGANPILPGESTGWTALFHLALGGKDDDIQALDLLLSHAVDGVKPDINLRDSDGLTPLQHLLRRQRVPKALLKAFIDRGADINSEDNDSSRPLQLASRWGELEVLRILTDGKSIDEIDDPDRYGNTALHEACLCSNPKCVLYLLELGANPNAQNHHGFTPLQEAASQGSEECIQTLIAYGADLLLADKHNRTPFFFACAAESTETATVLLDLLLQKRVPLAMINRLTKRCRSPLRQAAGKGSTEIVRKLIETAAAQDCWDDLAINVADEYMGMTPLHRAAWFGRTECVRLLLEGNADVSLKETDGKTALVLAYEQWTLASHSKPLESIVSMLIAQGPEAAKSDAELLAISAMNGSTRVLEQLSRIGADLNRTDQYGWTPLDLARNFNQKAALQFLTQ